MEKMSILSSLLFSIGIFLAISDDAQGALIVHRYLRTTAAPPPEIQPQVASNLKVQIPPKLQCLKITQNVAFEFLNFDIFHQFLSS